MTKRHSSLSTITSRFNRILIYSVLFAVSLSVCPVYAVRPEKINVLDKKGSQKIDKKSSPVRLPTSKQIETARNAVSSGITTVWHSRLGTPTSVRGTDLGKKEVFSGGKGLSLKGGGAYENDAVAVLDNLTPFFKMKDAEKEMDADRVESDELGYHHVRIKQKFNDLKVVGGDLIVHFNKRDLAYQVNGQYIPDIDINIVPTITADAAVQKAQDVLNGSKMLAGKLLDVPELVVYARDVDPLLAYEFILTCQNADGGYLKWRFWINAHTGETILYYNDVKNFGNATITGNILTGEGGDVVEVEGFEDDVDYYLWSMDWSWMIYNIASDGYVDAGSMATRDSADWADSDREEMSAARNFDLIQKYFYDVHGRISYDDEDATAYVFVHLGENYANAYWDGFGFWFGDGDGVNASSLGVLDVAAHEFTHAVTENTANLIYMYESGALNESFSDIFGACVEFNCQTNDNDSYPNSHPGQADWLLGEDCWLSSTAMRDMRNPANAVTVGAGNEQATRYLGEYWYDGDMDNGGVHYNSSVQNFFFYLLCEGGSGTNDGIVYDVEGIGISNAQQIAYRTLTVYCTPSTDYEAVRDAWKSAADDLFPEDDDPKYVIAVRDAWEAVGIESPPLVQLSSAGALPRGREWATYSYSIGVFSEANKHFWSLDSGSLPEGLSLDESTGIISGMPALATTAYFDVVVTNIYEEAVTNSYSLEILPVHTIPYAENFDQVPIIDGFPEFWRQTFQVNKLSWNVVQRQNDIHPEFAYSPTNFMSLFKADYNDNVTRLITPRIDFGDNALAGRLSFYHYMETYIQSTDELKVYYKTSLNGEWQLLQTYTSSISGWTQRVIDLPEISRQVYIAFEGTARYGYGVCVDSVKVWDPTPPYGFVTPSLLPSAVLDEPYETTIQVQGGYEPYTFSIVSNSLPAGITLSSDGVISGTAATLSDRVYVGIQVMDLIGQIIVQTYSIAVIEPYVTLFEEDFEHGGYLPTGWTQEYVANSAAWTAEKGGYIGHPLKAQEGLYNARLFTTRTDSDRITRLITPKINLGQAPDNISLYFWHYMEEYDGDQDELRILYRTSATGQWMLLAEFTENTPEWTQRSMVLPNPTADYYIAFEGTARFGYGVCVDNIRITDESLAPVIITENILPDGLIGYEYELQFEATGGVQPYNWALVEGTLPDGMTFSSEGLLSGIPQAEYLNDFKISVTGYDGQVSTNGFSLKIKSVPGIPFFEDFEKNGDMPAGWSQQILKGSANWEIATGTAHSTSPRKPVVAYSGSYNASLYSNSSSQNPAITRLITPMLDLGGGVTNAVLKFYHYMEEWLGDQDYLKVYYRTSLGGSWTLLAEYKSNTYAWTERTLALPSVSSTFFIAFESYGQYGHGICVDDVSIDGDIANPYNDWLSDNFSEIEIGTGIDTGYYADPDGDGIWNIWEYAYLLDPKVYNYSGTPTGGVVNTHLQLVYRQNKNATDLTFIVEACTNLLLGVWTTNDISEINRVDNGDWWEVVAQHDVPVTNAPTRFMRLKLLVD